MSAFPRPPSSSTSATSSTAGIPKPSSPGRSPTMRRGCASSRMSTSRAGTRALDGGRPYAEAAAELNEKFPHYAASDRRLERALRRDDQRARCRASTRSSTALDARGVPLFAITNFSADFWPPFLAKERAFFARFRDIVVSGEVKLLKPDPAIYCLALDRFRLRPAEALFVDDRADQCRRRALRWG